VAEGTPENRRGIDSRRLTPPCRSGLQGRGGDWGKRKAKEQQITEGGTHRRGRGQKNRPQKKKGADSSGGIVYHIVSSPKQRSEKEEKLTKRKDSEGEKH